MEFDSKITDKVVVYSDSQSAIHLCKNPVYYERTKHVDIKFHFVREIVSNGKIEIKKVSTEDNPADMGIKIVIAYKINPLHEAVACGGWLR